MFNFLSKYKVRRIFALISIVFFGISFFIVQAYALEFAQGDDLIINKPTKNLYASGKKIEIFSNIKKDLVATGGEVYINSDVERNVMISGGDIKIKTQFIGGSVYIIGYNIELSGTFNDDVFLIGNNIKLVNAKFYGDLHYLTANNLTIMNSSVAGKIAGNCKLEKDSYLQSSNTKIVVKNSQSIFIAWELSVIVCILSYFYVARRKHSHHISSLYWSKQLLIDMTIGLLAFISFLPILVSSFSLNLYPLIFSLVSINVIIFTLLCMILPIYIGIIIKNSIKVRYNTLFLIAFSYLILFMIGNVNSFSSFKIVIIAIALSFYGFILRKFYKNLRIFIKDHFNSENHNK